MFVHDLLFKYMHVDERKMDRSKSYTVIRPTTRLERLCSGALSLYDGEDEIVVMMYDTEQLLVHIFAGIFLTPAARLSQTARSHSTNMSDDPPNLAIVYHCPFDDFIYTDFFSDIHQKSVLEGVVKS
jgi:hypothetical protein